MSVKATVISQIQQIADDNKKSLPPNGYLCRKPANSATSKGPDNSQKWTLRLRNNSMHPITKSTAPTTEIRFAGSSNTLKKR